MQRAVMWYTPVTLLRPVVCNKLVILNEPPLHRHSDLVHANAASSLRRRPSPSNRRRVPCKGRPLPTITSPEDAFWLSVKRAPRARVQTKPR